MADLINKDRLTSPEGGLPIPKTFSEALNQRPEMRRLDHEEAVVLHGKHVLEATNRIRSLIDNNHFMGKSSREIFDEIHKIHFGTDQFAHH